MMLVADERHLERRQRELERRLRYLESRLGIVYHPKIEIIVPKREKKRDTP